MVRELQSDHRGKKQHYLYFKAHRNSRVREIMEEIISEYYTRDIGMEEVMESYVIILFTELLRVWRDETRKQASVSRYRKEHRHTL